MPKRYNTPHRSHVVKTRLTDEEYADFTERLAPYGISQSEFLRQAIRRTTMENIKQHDHRTTRRPDCVTEIRMGNTVLVVSGFFKKDTTSTAADKMARVLEAEAAATQKKAI